MTPERTGPTTMKLRRDLNGTINQESILLHYIVRYFEDPTAEMENCGAIDLVLSGTWHETNATRTFETIRGLVPTSVYCVAIAAVTVDGRSNFSDPQIVPCKLHVNLMLYLSP